MVMHDGVDPRLVAAEVVDQTVRKASEEQTPDPPSKDGARKRKSLELRQCRFEGRQETLSKSG